jgi:predicted neuraminidase
MKNRPMPLHSCRGVDAARAADRLSPLKRILYIGCTLCTALLAVHFTTRPDVVAPVAMAALQPIVSAKRVIDSAPSFTEVWLTPPGHTASAHSSAICALPSGDLLAVWYGGSREGAGDVALFTSRLPAGSSSWTTPILAMDRAMAEDELDRMIKKVGNAVIFPDGTGSLWMIYVTVSLGGWSGSTLNVKTSQDEGRTWGASQRLTINPFFNLSSLVRNKPIYTSDGRIGLPVYHEMAFKFPQMLWLTPGPNGTVQDYRMRNLCSEIGLIQPALVPLDGDRVLMVLRDRAGGRRLYTAVSEDSGWTWSDAAPTTLPNPDAAIDALRLRDGRILLAYNDSERRREILRLAISADQGRTWRSGAILEHGEELQEYSYPNLVEDQHGVIHITYTWHRERIKHVTFNTAWLDGQSVAEHSAAR